VIFSLFQTWFLQATQAVKSNWSNFIFGKSFKLDFSKIKYRWIGWVTVHFILWAFTKVLHLCRKFFDCKKYSLEPTYLLTNNFQKALLWRPKSFFHAHVNLPSRRLCSPWASCKLVFKYYLNTLKLLSKPWTTDTQWRHKSKISENLAWCGRQNMLRPYLKIWQWEWIFGRAVKAISSLCVRSPWSKPKVGNTNGNRGLLDSIHLLNFMVHIRVDLLVKMSNDH
jgi:hypothetical protein